MVIIRDDFAVGPLGTIYETEGYQRRRDWWKTLVDASPYNTEGLMHLADDRLTAHHLKKFLDDTEDSQLWIWAGQNAHDVCGYYWLITQLKEYSGRICILYLNNLPFINEKGGIFYPAYLHQIQPKEFLKAKKLCRKVMPSEFEVDSDEWMKLCAEENGVRVLEGGKKLVGKGYDYFDKDILTTVGTDLQKGHKAMHQILAKMKVKTGDVYLLWRMRQLQELEELDLQGDPAKGWKEFEVKLKGTPANAATPEPSNTVTA